MSRTASAADGPSMQHVRRAVRENDVRVAIEGAGRGWVIDLDGEVVAFAIGNELRYERYTPTSPRG